MQMFKTKTSKRALVALVVILSVDLIGMSFVGFHSRFTPSFVIAGIMAVIAIAWNVRKIVTGDYSS